MMSGIANPNESHSPLEIELYFLIAKFLSNGPCRNAAEVLRTELAEHKLLPKRIDWEGQEHQRSFENLVDIHRHISSNHLLKICERIIPLLNRDVKPSVEGVMSLLGAGRQSILRTEQDVKFMKWSSPTYAALHHGHPLKPPLNMGHSPNLAHITSCRQICGTARYDHIMTGHMYSKMIQMFRSLGHLSAVYCVSFDRTGQYIITGSDDHLVKVWSAVNGRLLCTFRGHAAEITDIACSYDNRLLAVGSCDKLIRIWCLKTSSPVAVLHGHTHMITSLRFCPYVKGDTRYLASTGGDGCLCIWEYNNSTIVFNLKPIKFIERSRAGTQMLCLSFSPGGVFLATGSTDHVVRVFSLGGRVPEKICELETHSDRIDSILYANNDSRFVSGSKDGTARIWRYERQEWRAIVLNMMDKLSSSSSKADVDVRINRFRVTMVCWNADDTYVITAVNDFSLKVWNSHTGELCQVLQGHDDEVYVLEHNPVDKRIVLSAGHDGNIVVWDIETGVKIRTFKNMIEGQGHGAVFDCKWSPDGLSFAATDSHGFLLYFGFGSNDKYKKLPQEIYFHTDYRPLIRDANNFVLDEQTQHPPHLMSPPFLVDIDGNPYPPKFQRLVPGREDCQDMALVPLVVVTANGVREVLDDINGGLHAMATDQNVPAAEVAVPNSVEERPIIDEMIARMQHEQDQRLSGGSSRMPVRPSRNNNSNARQARRNQSIETMRQRSSSAASVPESNNAPANMCIWMHRTLVKELDRHTVEFSEKWRCSMAEEELKSFHHEKRKKPLLLEMDSSDSGSHMRTRRKPKHSRSSKAVVNEETGRNRLEARALYDTETEEGGSSVNEGVASEHEHNDTLNTSTNTVDANSSSDNESSAYSDWVPDGATLQPPKRQSQRQIKRKRWRYPDDNDSDETEIEDMELDDDSPKNKKSSSKSIKKETKKLKRQKKVLDRQNEIRDLPPEFRPPEWLTSVVPHKAPYFPQMGDEVIYFMQGHQQYVEAVKNRNAYTIDPTKNQPWHKLPYLREQELMKVVGIKYELRPPRLVCLKLAFIDPETSRLVGGTFTIKYHDMTGVIDFVILRETYNLAMYRNWNVGDRFRCVIDETWWHGVIETREPLQEEYPDSMYQCFIVKWDNSEQERLSPWDLEPIDKNRIPQTRGGSVSVTQTELEALLYPAKPSEWPENGREAECDRIIRGLEQIMELSIAEPFLVPVDLNSFPVYAMVIEYPIDLSTIKERLENRFYRRVAAIQYDVRQIETNARTFNEPNSRIVKSARNVTELFLRFISDHSCYDLMPLYSQLTKESPTTARSSGQNRELSSDEEHSKYPRRNIKQRTLVRSTKRRNRSSLDPDAWKEDCKQLLSVILDNNDSTPFREPVRDCPDYNDVVSHPMDLSTVRMKLNDDRYTDPNNFCSDVRLVFTNSRLYNTNKRSRIYAMTLRLSALFEDQVKQILKEFKSSNKHRRKDVHSLIKKSPQKCNSTTSVTSKALKYTRTSNLQPRYDAVAGHRPGPSNSSSSMQRQGKRRRVLDDSDDEFNPEPPRPVVTTAELLKQARKIRNRSKGIKRVKKRNGNVDSMDEDEIDRKEELQNEDLEEENSDEDFKINQRRNQPTKKQKKKDKCRSTDDTKQTSERYSTRCATGSIKRRRYDKAFDDEDDEADESHNKSNHDESTPPAGKHQKEADDPGFDVSTSESSESDTDEVGSGSDTETYSDRSGPVASQPRETRSTATSTNRVKTKRPSDNCKNNLPSNSRIFHSKLKNSRYSTRFQGRRTVRYQEDSDLERGDNLLEHELSDTDIDDEIPQQSTQVSVSSRGRLHKPSVRLSSVV